MSDTKATTGGAAGRSRKRASPLDRIDLAILDALRENARLTYQALSQRVGLSARPALERVRRLERVGVIRGYTARIDPAAVGHHIIAFAEIVLRDSSAATRQRLERALSAQPAVVEISVVSGEYDYLARIVAPTLPAYEALIDAFLTEPSYGIARVHSTFLLRELKAFEGYPAGSASA